jgi:hypothetical protein
MFKLVLRDGAPENAGIHEGIETALTTLTVGQAVTVAAGKAVYATAEDGVYGIVTEPVKEGVVTVLKVTPDQVFKVRLTSVPESLAVGGKVTITNGTGNVTATIVDPLDATEAGDYIEVRFEK